MLSRVFDAELDAKPWRCEDDCQYTVRLLAVFAVPIHSVNDDGTYMKEEERETEVWITGPEE